jgi:hypothetical protein
MMEKITGPIEGHGHSGVKDVKSYKDVHARVIKAAGKDVFEIASDVYAYINQGRWVVDCVCNGAGLTSPEFGVTCCFDCGRVYTSVVFPGNRGNIEKLLVLRKEKERRNWNRGESLADIEAEGVGS